MPTASKAPHRVPIGMASRKDHAGISLTPASKRAQTDTASQTCGNNFATGQIGGAARQALQRYIYRIFRGLMPWSVPGMPKRLTTSSGNCFLSLVNAVFTPLLSLFGFCEIDPHDAAFCCWFLLMLCDMIATMIKRVARSPNRILRFSSVTVKSELAR